MKKLITLVLLMALGCPVFAQIQAPKWSEFAPSGYSKVEYIKDDTLPNWANVLLACSIVGSPIAIYNKNKYEQIESNNYWYSRRKEFEERLNSLQNITNENELAYEYLSIRQDELSKNANRKMSIMQNQQRYLATQQRIQNANSQDWTDQLTNYNNFKNFGY